MPCVEGRNLWSALAVLWFVAGLGIGADPVGAQSADDLTVTSANPEGAQKLQLLVILNGHDTGVICAFSRVTATSELSATRADLADAGIAAPAGMGREVLLSAFADARYDEATQTVEIDIPTAMLVPRVISAGRRQEERPATSGRGLVLNYRLAANLGDDLLSDGFDPKSLYAALDLRAYSPLGVLSQTGAISSTDLGSGVDWTRHETSFVHVAQSRMLSVTLGDFVSAGPSWSSPLRMAGVQLSRDFTLDGSFVTDPQLSHSGVAVLPSALDVFVNNVKAWSGKVDAGPFVLQDLPMVSPQGEAIFVLRDATGQGYVSRVPFFASHNLLRKGVADYALQVGYARQGYGQSGFDYGSERIGSASLRYGVTDRLTVSGHVEAASDLVLAGAGIDTVLLHRAELGLSVAHSQTDLNSGTLVAVALRTRVAGMDLRATERRRIGAFDDLASYLSAAEEGASGYRPAELERAVSLSIPLAQVGGYAALSVIQTRHQTDEALVVSASYAQALGRNGAAFRVNAFHDLSDGSDFGLSVGLSFPFGNEGHSDLQAGTAPDGFESRATVSRYAGHAAGDVGYRLALYDRQGRKNATFGMTHQGRYARSDLTVRWQDGALSAYGTVAGAIVLGGGGVFAARRIDDGFAIVDVGVPDVTVSLNNRPAAMTGRRGRALVGDLRSYQANRVSIDPLSLPATASVTVTAMDAVPMRRSGVVLSFGGGVDRSALIVLRDTAGAFVPVGASVRIGRGEAVPVGYDGEVWIDGLKPENDLVATMASGTCRARFPFAPDPDQQQVVIDPVVCR